jgi:serine/threonine protein kinase
VSERLLLSGENPKKPTYVFLQTMREGNTAMTYKMAHEIFGRDVVQKTISLLGLDDALAGTEPQLLDSVRHPHIVEVREAQWTPAPEGGIDLRLITFVMPFYPGGSLAEALDANGPVPNSAGISIADGLFQALHYLHTERRVLHRDIKPANIFLDETRSYPYLGDLGSAADMAPDGSSLPAAGTQLYRAPELEKGRYTNVSDLYSAGMTLLELFGGPLPYANLDPADIETRVRSGARAVADRWFKSLPPTVPTAVARLVSHLCDSDPNQRPQTAAEALAVLSKVAVIDWHADDAPGELTGRWTPSGLNRCIMVRQRKIQAGPSKGLLDLTTHYRLSDDANWKTAPGSHARISPTNIRQLRSYFDETVKLAAKRWPAR